MTAGPSRPPAPPVLPAHATPQPTALMGRRRPRSCSRTRELRAGAELGALGNRAAGEASSSRRRFAPPSSLPSPLIVPVECDLPLEPSWRTTMSAENPDLAIAQDRKSTSELQSRGHLVC